MNDNIVRNEYYSTKIFIFVKFNANVMIKNIFKYMYIDSHTERYIYTSKVSLYYFSNKISS